jgi:uncharacterized oxidoreductase
VEISDRTVLVTGGTSGIGLGLAEAFYRANSKVIVCGRDKRRLSDVRSKFPGIAALHCDVGDAREREGLSKDVLGRFPDLDILVNNAGVQRYIDLKKGYRELKSGDDEIAINLVGTIELTALFIDHLMKRPEAAVINVSSGLAFSPMSGAPIYCATKAAVHVYSLLLRRQLADTTVRVFEIIPPMVDTNLNKAGRDRAHLKYRGVATSEYIPAVIEGLQRGSEMIFYGDGEKAISRPRSEAEGLLL